MVAQEVLPGHVGVVNCRHSLNRVGNPECVTTAWGAIRTPQLEVLDGELGKTTNTEQKVAILSKAFLAAEHRLLQAQARGATALSACRCGAFFHATYAICASQFMSVAGVMGWDELEGEPQRCAARAHL